MQKVIVGVGIAGAGKTTILKSFAERNHYAFVGIDEIRIALVGDIGDLSRNREVWDLARKKVSDFIKAGMTVVFDAPLARLADRRNFISWLRGEGVQRIQGLYVSVPFEIAKERNSQRTRVVPDKMMESMHKSVSLFPPDMADGFDTLFVLNEHQELKKVEVARESRILRREMR